MKKFLPIAIAGALFALQANAMSDTPDTGYTEAQYPIVLVPGFTGFDDILGVDYWYKIPEALQKDGAKVYVTNVSALDSSEQRGEQLLEQVQQITALAGVDKVNLIGHSQGGPTVRYVASVAPELVASVSSVGGAHKGTPVADVFQGLADDDSTGIIEGALETFGSAFGEVINFLSGGSYDQSMMRAIGALTTEGAAEFNAKHPQGIPTTECGDGEPLVNGIHYYSWGGQQPITNPLDISDALTGVASLMFPEGMRNDGIVPTCGSRMGQVIRDDFKMNHIDEINHLFGLRSLLDTDPVEVFRVHANRLKEKGL